MKTKCDCPSLRDIILNKSVAEIRKWHEDIAEILLSMPNREKSEDGKCSQISKNSQKYWDQRDPKVSKSYP